MNSMSRNLLKDLKAILWITQSFENVLLPVFVRFTLCNRYIPDNSPVKIGFSANLNSGMNSNFDVPGYRPSCVVV